MYRNLSRKFSVANSGKENPNADKKHKNLYENKEHQFHNF